MSAYNRNCIRQYWTSDATIRGFGDRGIDPQILTVSSSGSGPGVLPPKRSRKSLPSSETAGHFALTVIRELEVSETGPMLPDDGTNTGVQLAKISVERYRQGTIMRALRPNWQQLRQAFAAREINANGGPQGRCR